MHTNIEASISRKSSISSTYIHLISRIEQHEKWLTTKGMSGQQAIFSEADFGHISLVGRNLSYAVLKNCKLIRSDLQGANFKGADLSGADLSYCNLTNVRFDGAQIGGTKFDGATLDGARFDDISIHKAKFRYASLKNSIFSNCSLNETTFKFANLLNTDFSSSILNKIDFSESLHAGTKLPPDTSFADFASKENDEEDISTLYIKALSRTQKGPNKIYRFLLFAATNILTPIGVFLLLLGVIFRGVAEQMNYESKLRDLSMLIESGGFMLLLAILILLVYYLIRMIKRSHLPVLNMNYESSKNNNIVGEHHG